MKKQVRTMLILIILCSLACGQTTISASFSFANNSLYRFAKNALNTVKQGTRGSFLKKATIVSGVVTVVGFIVFLIGRSMGAEERRGNINNMTQAAQLGNLDQVRRLVEQGTNINGRRSRRQNANGLYGGYGYRRTAIEIATHNNNLDIVKYLLDNKAKASKQLKRNMFEKALREGHQDLIEHFDEKEKMDLQTTFFSNHQTPLHLTCASGNLETTQQLLEKGLDVNVKDTQLETPLHKACQSGNIDLVRHLLDNCCVQVDAHAFGGKTPLHVAAQGGHLEIAQLLVGNEEKLVVADVNARYNNRTALHTAVERGDIPFARFLLENGANVNAVGPANNTPLIIAIQQNNREMVELLIEHEANVNIQGQRNLTPLIAAIQQRNRETIGLLLENGADVNLMGPNNSHPLTFAVTQGDLEVTQLLIQHNSDVNVIIGNDRTLLHVATENNNPQMVRLLVQNGANINTIGSHYEVTDSYFGYSTEYKATPLSLALKNGYMEIADYLIGAEIDKKADIPRPVENNRHKGYNRQPICKTPFEIACEKGHLRAAKMLAEKGATVPQIYEALIPEQLKKQPEFMELKNAENTPNSKQT